MYINVKLLFFTKLKLRKFAKIKVKKVKNRIEIYFLKRISLKVRLHEEYLTN